MRVEDQIRNLASNLEANQTPVSVDEIVSGISAANVFDDTVDDGAGRSRRGWMAIAAAVVVLVAGLGALWLLDGNDASRIVPVESPATSTSSAPTTSTTPATTSLSADAVLGETIMLDEDGRARVNSLTPNAVVVNELVDPPAAGSAYTEVDVERCAGSNGSHMDSQNAMNSGNWSVLLDDGSKVGGRPDYFVTFWPIPGGCSSGSMVFEVPDDSSVVQVVLDTDGPTGLMAAVRWDVTRTTAVSGPLEPYALPEAATIGEPMSLEEWWGPGTTATVRRIAEVEPTAEFGDLAAGRKVVEIEVELCAGSEASLRNPADLKWLITTTDNRTASSDSRPERGGIPLEAPTAGSLRADGELVTGPLVLNQCAVGVTNVDLPADGIPEYVIMTDDFGRTEIARTLVTDSSDE